MKTPFKIGIILMLVSAFAPRLCAGQDLARKTLSIADAIVVSANNATAGNTGLLPSVYANGSYDFQKNDTDLEIAMFNEDGSQAVTPISVDGAETEVFAASINAEYTLFDGLGGYHRLHLLEYGNPLPQCSGTTGKSGHLARAIEH